MIKIKKRDAYEAVCRAFNFGVHPEDYGFDENDYESLWAAVMHNGQLLMVEDDGHSMFRDDDGHPVWLYRECGFDTPQEMQHAFKAGILVINTLAELAEIELC